MTSNLKSPLVLKNTAPGQVELLDYKHRLNTGINTTLPIKLTNNANVAGASTNLSGVSEQWSVNRSGKLFMLYAKTYFTISSSEAKDTTSLDLSGLGKKFCNCQVNTSGDLVYNQPADAFGSIFARLTPSQKSQVNYMTQVFEEYPVNTTTAAATSGFPVPLTTTITTLGRYYTYTPILGPFWQNERLNWDLQILEQLTLNVNYPFTNAQLGLGSSINLYQTAGRKAEAFAVYRDYEVDYKKDLYLSNFGTDGKDRSYLGYTLESRRFDLTSTTSTSFKVPFKTPCANFNVAIVPLTIGAAFARRPVNVKILSFKLVLDSQTYIENVDPEVLGSIGGMYNGISTEMVCTSAGVCSERAAKDETSVNVVLATRPSDLTSFSGALAYATIEDPQITVGHYDVTTAANFKIVYSHLIYAESLMNGVSGSFVLTKSA